MAETFQDWMIKLGTADRVPPGWQVAISRDPHAKVLRGTGLHYVGSYEFFVEQSWTLESLAGFVYSTSFLNRQVLGAAVPDFERDLSTRLLVCEPARSFTAVSSYSHELAQKLA